MGRTSRTKGQTGERELAGLLRDLLGFDVRRRVRQHDGDSDLEGVPGWSVECKRYRAATRGDLAGWWTQAVAQANRDSVLPVLFYRLDRAEWRAVWPLAILLTEQHADYWQVFDWTADTSVPAWAAVARERVHQGMGLEHSGVVQVSAGRQKKGQRELADRSTPSQQLE